MQQVLILVGVFLVLDIVFILLFILNYRRGHWLFHRNDLKDFFRFLIKAPPAEIDSMVRRNWRQFLFKYLRLRESFRLPEKVHSELERIFERRKIIQRISRFLRSRSQMRRKMGIQLLGAIRVPVSGRMLEEALMREKKTGVKIILVNTLVESGYHEALPAILDSLIGAPLMYRNIVGRVAVQFGQAIHRYFPSLVQRREPEIHAFLITYSRYYSDSRFAGYLLEQVEHAESAVACQAFESLLASYRQRVNLPDFLKHRNPEIVRKTLEALGADEKFSDTDTLMHYLNIRNFHKTAVVALTNHIQHIPQALSYLLDTFAHTAKPLLRKGLASVFSNKIDYFLFRILSPEKEKIKGLLQNVLQMGFVSAVITFLNSNHNPEIENEILALVRQVLPEKPDLEMELRKYLKERILRKINLEKVEPDNDPFTRKVPVQRSVLIFLLAASLLFFPLLFFIQYGFNPPGETFFAVFKIFLIRLNYYFIYYSLLVNSIYLILLVLAFWGIRRSRLNRMVKGKNLLRKEGILPSISIIAPAYCEENSIIENVTSLLVQDYPDYEVIVVNDGSTDRTLSVLTDYFKLHKIDVYYEARLKTEFVRGIYRSKSYPRLTVVDKRNGGKADALNAGINLARCEYCCGIDADSLLETQALMEAASLTLDSERETCAIGGVVLPVNGCLVEKGQIVKATLGRSFLSRAQTIEYFRAFTSSRIGWSVLQSLAIISGAFGVFKRDRLFQIRGYLSSIGPYAQDTVGEDMELVVRIIRLLTIEKQKFRILYAPFAICWTEVPEQVRMLVAQRNRWQRGLIESLSLHRNMIFNPQHTNLGMLSFPYFLFFEVIGPWLELTGYLGFILGLILGILNPAVILMVFVAAILFGILLSIGALFISVRIRPLFSAKDYLILVLYAFLENFGFRQWMSYTRVQGYFGVLTKRQDWVRNKRRGFSRKEKL